MFKGLLEQAGYTQADFAKVMKVSQKSVSAWATGKVRVPFWAIQYLSLYIAVKKAIASSQE